MLTIVIVIAAVIVAAPLGAAAIVTVASLREDAEQSLSGRPPGRLEAISRRILGSVPAVRSASPRRRRARASDLPSVPRLRLSDDEDLDSEPTGRTLTGPLS